MKPNTAIAGECIYDKFKLQYQVVSLEYIRNKSLKIEAVCYNPGNPFNKEATFKYSTKRLNTANEKLKIAFLIIDSIVKNLTLPKDKLFKLIIRDHKVFYIHSL